MEREVIERNGNFSAVVTVYREEKPVTLMRSLHTKDRQKAVRIQGIVNDIMTDLELGKKKLPEGVAYGDEMFWRWLLEWNGEDRKVEQAKNNRTLDALLTDYIDARKASNLSDNMKITDAVYARHVRRYMAESGKQFIRASDVDEEFFKGYQTFRNKAGVEPQTVNKELAWFSTLCKRSRKYIPANPLPDVTREKSEASAQRFRTATEIKAELAERDYSKEDQAAMWDARILTKPEIGRILGLAKTKDPSLYPMTCVAAFTGARRSEIARLKWSNVDFGTNKVWIIGLKGSRSSKYTSRDVEMHPELKKALLEQYQKTRKAEYVFPDPKGREFNVDDMTERLNALTAGTEFEHGVGWHCFRHSLASWMAADGKDQRVIDGILGHTTRAMADRYRHLMPKAKKAAAEVLGGIRIA